MKKYLLKITALVLFFGIITSCEEDKVVYSGSQSLAAFVGTSGSLPVFEVGVSTLKIGVEISSKSSTARTIEVSVDGTSTALASQYVINSASLVIPADSYSGEIIVTGNFDNLNVNEVVTLILNLDKVGDATVEPSKSSFALSVYKSCPSNLAGTYVATNTNMSEPGGGKVAGPITASVKFVEVGVGLYSISDASFGGWTGLYGAGNIATGVKLKDICNQISYSGVDQYGEVFTFSNLVVNGSKLSFHWENDYGEYGDTTLSRTDGTSWPDLKL